MPQVDAAATPTSAAGRDYLTVSSYAEAEEVLRRAQEFSISGNKPGAAPYLRGHVATIDGRRHLERRRRYRDLFKASSLAAYDTSFAASVRSTLAWYRRASPASVQPLAFDLIAALRRAYGQVIAELIGLDLTHDAPEWEGFQRDVDAIVEVVAADFARGDVQEIHARGLEASRHLRDVVLRPALARRRALLARARGAAAQVALPQDIVSFMLLAAESADLGADDEFDDEAILRECQGFLVGGANNPSASAAWSLLELERWLAVHPEDRSRLADWAFLDAVVKESLRLHRTGAPFLIRRALVDVRLRASGLEIPAGQWVAVDIPRANRDPEVFGPDADRFDPHRSATADQRPYGLAFATGPHVCIARPMMVDDDDRTERLGMQVEALAVLLDAGVRTDPRRPPTAAAHGGERFAAFPVLMDVRPGSAEVTDRVGTD